MFTVFEFIQDVESAPAFLVGVDGDGEIVWYHEHDLFRLTDARVTPDDTIMYVEEGRAAYEIDWMGDMQREWRAREVADRPVDGDHPVIDIDTDSIHHTFYPTGDGTIITMSSLIETYPYPDPQCPEGSVSETMRWDGELDFVSDVIVEADIDTGEIVFEWVMTDYIDPLELRGWGVCGAYAGPVEYDDFERRVDWSHGNAAFLDEATNSIVTSYRHLDLLVAIRRHDDSSGPAGEMLWRLGLDGDVELLDGAAPFAGQHSPEVLDDGTMLLYDNQAGPLNATVPNQSRSLRYEIDPVAGTARELESVVRVDEDGLPVWAIAVGDVDLLSDGHWLIVDGLQLAAPTRAEVTEVDPATGEEHLRVRVAEGERRFVIYRAMRIENPVAGG